MKGWRNPAGDAFFKKQRQNADQADEKRRAVFYNVMQEITWEMHESTDGALLIPDG